MAIRIDIDKATAQQLFDNEVARIKRAINTSKQPQFRELYETELRRVTAAATTIAEIK